ncbi:hypothetical protein H7142_01315 [Candidatus Saccharibacteria bacterium]|nr:hypothetical protein [Candidatus Saccharibacteria bacterium]
MFEDDGLSLIYFTSDPVKGKRILESGANSLLLDCETSGKTARQQGFDTEINSNDPSQIKELRRVNPTAHIMCRVSNPEDPTVENQINTAINAGSNTIVLPITETALQIQRINKIIDGRANLIIMIETQIGVDNFAYMAKKSSFDAVYIGLNDLSISRGGKPIFEPLKDGTVEYIISTTSKPVGVGGVTDPSYGHPVKSAEIIKLYADLGVKFTVLRRSFNHVISDLPPKLVINNIRAEYNTNINKSLVLVAK